MHELVNTHQPKKLYMVEFLRIFFVFSIILSHICNIYPEINYSVTKFFSINSFTTGFSVECFFIIGGFFLYNKIINSLSIYSLIQKIYLRLLPAFLVVFILTLLGAYVPIYKLPIVLTLTTGLSIPASVTGWGDWYVGAYFWTCCLYICILYFNLQKGLIATVILVYISTCITFHNTVTGLNDTYFTIIGSQLIRGIYSVGIGICAAALMNNFKPISRFEIRIVFTIIEGIILFATYTAVLRKEYSPYNFFERELIFAFLLISSKFSWGYFSQYLNKLAWIEKISCYSYPIFLSHIVPLKILQTHNNYGLSELNCALLIFGGAIFIGITEYHLIEQKLVPYLKKYFKENS